MRYLPALALLAVGALLAACGSTPSKPPPAAPPAPAPPSKPGYYKDDGPGESPPANLDSIPDAQPRPEALHRFANRPYTVFGREYVPATSLRPYKERGIASWYGRKFHGEKTSIGETYDMYAMTAAHPTLPLPSYARVTNVATGKSVVVRVNDRGPFLHGPRDRPLVCGGVADRDRAEGQRRGRGRGDHPRRDRARGGRAAAAGRVGARRGAAAGPAAAPRRARRCRSRRPTAASRCSSAPSPTTRTRRTSVAHLANQLAPLGVEAKVRQVDGLFRVFVGPYPTREEARRDGGPAPRRARAATTIGLH